jgi:hypothetical protein
MLRRPAVMFHVIAVVKKWSIVEESVVALRAASMLEISVDIT